MCMLGASAASGYVSPDGLSDSERQIACVDMGSSFRALKRSNAWACADFGAWVSSDTRGEALRFSRRPGHDLFAACPNLGKCSSFSWQC